MPSVGLWNEDSLETVRDIVLVRQNLVEDLLQLVRSGDLPPPKKIFVVAPNGYGLEDFLCLYVLGMHHDWDIGAVEASMSSLPALLGLWRDLLKAVADLDHTSASMCIREIGRLALPAQSKSSRLTAILDEYVRMCIQPLSDCRFFRTYDPKREVAWWDCQDGYRDSIGAFRKILAAGLTEMPALKVLDDCADRAAKQWTSMAGKPTADKFFDMSAFCFGLAERYFSLGYLQWSYLLAYRSVDLYFQQLALRENIIIEKATELGYLGNTNKVYLMDLEYALFQAQALSSNEGRRQFLVRINRTRNMLLATHGAHHVTETEVRDVLNDCADFVYRIESSTKWKQRSVSFFPALERGLAMLFETVPDIHTFVEDRTGLLQGA